MSADIALILKSAWCSKAIPYSGIGIEATPVRFAMGTHGIGVKFDEIFVTSRNGIFNREFSRINAKTAREELVVLLLVFASIHA